MLISARHPGLTGRVVPITIRLGGEYTAVVITGPNTGGKTVTLRPNAQPSLMHQAGLPLPTATSTSLPGCGTGFAGDRGEADPGPRLLEPVQGVQRVVVFVPARLSPSVDELGRPVIRHFRVRGGR